MDTQASTSVINASTEWLKLNTPSEYRVPQFKCLKYANLGEPILRPKPVTSAETLWPLSTPNQPMHVTYGRGMLKEGGLYGRSFNASYDVIARSETPEDSVDVPEVFLMNDSVHREKELINKVLSANERAGVRSPTDYMINPVLPKVFIYKRLPPVPDKKPKKSHAKRSCDHSGKDVAPAKKQASPPVRHTELKSPAEAGFVDYSPQPPKDHHRQKGNLGTKALGITVHRRTDHWDRHHYRSPNLLDPSSFPQYPRVRKVKGKKCQFCEVLGAENCTHNVISHHQTVSPSYDFRNNWHNE